MAASACAQQSPTPATGTREWCQHELQRIEQLKQQNQYDLAWQAFEQACPGFPPNGTLTANLRTMGAEIRRKVFDWQGAEHWLDRAEAALADEPQAKDRAQEQVLIDIGRSLVQLGRGLPDLAFEDLERARQAAPHDDIWSDYQICQVELLLLRALDRSRESHRVLQAYEAKWHDVRPALRLRAASAILQDADSSAAELADVDQWLAAAPDESANERSHRLILRIVRYLDAGDHAAAAAALASAAESIPDRGLSEQRLGLQALSLRYAHEAGLPEAATRARHDALAELWRQMCQQIANSDALRRQHTGLGVMQLIERQRTLCELMRTAVRFDGASGATNALQLLLDVEQLGTMANNIGAAPCTVASVQQHLCRDGGGLLVYFAGPEFTWAFTVDAEHVEVERLPLRDLWIARQVRELLRVVQLSRSDEAADLVALDAKVREVSAALLPAALTARVARWRCVSIVGLESLGYVPFELLWLAHGQRLGLTLPVRYLPSMVVGAFLAEHRPVPAHGADGRGVMLACPDTSPPGEYAATALPFGSSERRLLRGNSDDRLEMLTGTDATLAVAAPHLAGAGLLTMLAHGARDDRRIDPQGIVLGDGITAWPADLAAQALPPCTVIAACRAGRGRLRRGDDGCHLLSGAALMAGARAVVTPWLDVDYRRTLTLLASLHQGLLEDGLTLDDALLQARRAVVAEHGERAIDAFLFHLHGLGDIRIASPRARAPVAGSTVMLAATAAGAMAFAVVFAVVLPRRRRARRAGQH